MPGQCGRKRTGQSVDVHTEIIAAFEGDMHIVDADIRGMAIEARCDCIATDIDDEVNVGVVQCGRFVILRGQINRRVFTRRLGAGIPGHEYEAEQQHCRCRFDCHFFKRPDRTM